MTTFGPAVRYIYNNSVFAKSALRQILKIIIELNYREAGTNFDTFYCNHEARANRITTIDHIIRVTLSLLRWQSVYLMQIQENNICICNLFIIVLHITNHHTLVQHFTNNDKRFIFPSKFFDCINFWHKSIFFICILLLSSSYAV